MSIQKDPIVLMDALEEGFNRALPDPKTHFRGDWQPETNAVGNVVETFCNYFTAFIAQSFGYLKLNAMTANQMVDFLSDAKNGWLKVEGAIAQSHANAGCLVIAAWKNPDGHGHVCVICPGRMQISGSYGKSVPKCVNVGKDVFFGKRVSFAFREEPAYFVLGEMV